ncbi:phosphotransferase [Mycobacterium fragae]|jgi:aminoglycoside phosphotransferase (APT) family kinase protein|uniref:Aminoglycoside phosphotransferase n=1 Tax=Mycobacterium fragae TaxID=1260918 RepID=A0A1X1UJX1_9MYCO|nr:phosphotransferase [Mycobacterium fragae]MCV7400862.1 phosphotransferase [Mycobacterium fragae]ORV57150.1 aminoglycoside phosphotransferase [Mycobacterium fragae]
MAELVPVLPAHRIDEAALAQYLRGRLPGFDGTVQIRQFQGGQSNPTYHLRTDAGDYVLRKKPPGKLLPRAHEVEREHRVMAALADTDVPVPRMRLLCQDESVLGTTFFVMDHVPGRVFPDRVMRESTPEHRAAVYEDLARVLAALHRVDWRAVGLEGFGRPEGYMQRQVVLWTRQWRAAQLEEMPAMDLLAQWLPEHLPPDDAAAACIAHGDYRLGNVLIHPTEPRVVAVLDWELATIGNPLADLAYFCLTYRLPGGADGRSGVAGEDLVGTGIPDQQALVASYCRYADREQPESLDAFIVFSLFRLASIVAGVWRRGVEGNAADTRATEFRERYRELAQAGWDLAQRFPAAG